MPPLSSCMYRNSTSAAFISSLPWSSRYLFRSGKLPLSCRRSRPTLLIWRKGETGVLWTAPRHSWYLPVLSPAHRTSRFNTVALVDFDAGDPNAMPQSHSLTPDELLRETHRFVEKHPHDKSSLHLARRRRLNAFIALFGGVVCLPFYGHVLAELVIPRGTVQMQIVITGAFVPLVGILFAMLSSTAVVALRQRQQDLRDLLHQELSLIRMLLVMIRDENIIKLLLKYTLELESETFSHKQNGISYDYEVPGTREATRREEIFAESEETLWHCFEMANELRLRPEVEGVIRNLVTFRTRRRAVLDSGLPQIHFVITSILGISMLFGFGLLVANDITMVDVLATRLLFGVILALLTLTYALITDLRDPFGGDYGVTPWRLYHTVELLKERLKNGAGADRRKRSAIEDSGLTHPGSD